MKEKKLVNKTDIIKMLFLLSLKSFLFGKIPYSSIFLEGRETEQSWHLQSKRSFSTLDNLGLSLGFRLREHMTNHPECCTDIGWMFIVINQAWNALSTHPSPWGSKCCPDSPCKWGSVTSVVMRTWHFFPHRWYPQWPVPNPGERGFWKRGKECTKEYWSDHVCALRRWRNTEGKDCQSVSQNGGQCNNSSVFLISFRQDWTQITPYAFFPFLQGNPTVCFDNDFQCQIAFAEIVPSVWPESLLFQFIPTPSSSVCPTCYLFGHSA